MILENIFAILSANSTVVLLEAVIGKGSVLGKGPILLQKVCILLNSGIELSDNIVGA